MVAKKPAKTNDTKGANSALTAQFIENMTPSTELFEGYQGEMPIEEPTLAQSILCHVLLLETVMMRTANRITEARELTFTQWMALSMVSHEGKIGITHSELSRRLMLSKAPVTAVVDRLERDGMVLRVADKSDRRVSRVVITSKGLEQWDAVRMDMDDYGKDLLNDLTASEQKLLLPGLAKLLDALAKDDPIMKEAMNKH